MEFCFSAHGIHPSLSTPTTAFRRVVSGKEKKGDKHANMNTRRRHRSISVVSREVL